MRIASIGTGVIVEQFLDACKKVEGIELVAVYSRNYETGKNLAQKFDIDLIITNFDELIANKSIDTIYIASPNSLHHEQAKLTMLAGKNAIVEKPFTSNDRETDELIRIAKQNGVYLFEAMSILHMPNLELLKIKLELIGPIKWAEASMCQFSSKYNSFKKGELPNVFNPVFSGGALMDLNIYNLYFFSSLFGLPKNLMYFPNLHENGIDLSGLLLLEYPDLKISAVSTKDSVGKPYGSIHGENGMIEFNDGINGLRSFTLKLGKEEQIFNVQRESNRLVYEVTEIERIVREKDTHKMWMLLDFTQKMMKLLTQCRKQANLIFEADKTFN